MPHLIRFEHKGKILVYRWRPSLRAAELINFLAGELEISGNRIILFSNVQDYRPVDYIVDPNEHFDFVVRPRCLGLSRCFPCCK